MGKFIDSFSRRVAITNRAYKKSMLQTYMTACEWRNVEIAEEVAQHHKEMKPFYSYPYFRQIVDMWAIFFSSYRASKKYHSHSEIIFSDYMVMNIFILLNTTIELFVRGLISIPFMPLSLFGDTNQTGLQQELGNIYDDYSKFIHHTPFYNYPFLSKIGSLWGAFWHSDSKSFTDLVSLFFTSLEFLAKSIMTFPVALYTSSISVVPESTSILVKLSSGDPGITEQELKQELITKIGLAQDDFRAGVANSDLELKICEVNVQQQVFARSVTDPTTLTKQHRKYAYARIDVPRYELFVQAMRYLNLQGIRTKSVAGQGKVQVRYILEADTQDSLTAGEAALSARLARVTVPVLAADPVDIAVAGRPTVPASTLLYSYQNHMAKPTKIYALEVDTRRLDDALEAIEEVRAQGYKASIRMVHDF